MSHTRYDKPIMVVDDDPMVLMMLKDTLEEAGYKVATFDNAADALAELEKGEIELVVSDHNMPELTGLDLLKKVNEMKARSGRNIQVIMLTAQKDGKIALELVKNDAFSYHAKPINVQQFLMDIERAIVRLRLP